MVRLKNRYLLVNILYPELDEGQLKTTVPNVVAFNQATAQALNPQALLKGLRAEIQLLFGDYGAGAVSDSLTVKYLSNATSTFILRVTRPHYKIAWAALSMMTKVPIKDGKKCVFQVVRVSGTMRKAEQEAIRRAREIILQTRREIEEKGKDSSTLESIFGKEPETKSRDVTMVDGSDSEEDELSDGND